MGRIKPAALLRQSKKQKAPARPSVTAIAGSLALLVMVLLSIAFISKQRGKDGVDQRSSSQYAVFNTSKGMLTLQLSGRLEPKAVESFVTHSQNGDYNGWRFHKVKDGLVIQGGDQGSNGVEEVSVADGKVNDESGAGVEYEPFTLTVENLGVDTNTSRFLIITTATPQLNRDRHAVIGRFVDGQSVLQDLEPSLTDKNRQALDDVVIYNILLRSSL
ncbi:unnamed protein product [Calypogeia fissa]